MNNLEKELPWWQKALALGIVCVIIVVFFLGANYFIKPSSDNPASTCETRFDSTSCPDPNEPTDEQVRHESDQNDAIYNDYDSSLQAEEERRQEQMRKEIEAELEQYP